jgi:hypothetical protein
MERLKLKNNLLTKKDIEHYCQSVEEILKKINNRSSQKIKPSKENEHTPEQELMVYE